MIKRVPIVTRIPVTFKELRKPIFLDSNEWYPVEGFEGVYEIDAEMNIRKCSTQEFIKQNHTSKDVICVMRHPDGDGSALTASVYDVWCSTFLGDNSIYLYSYMDSIKRRHSR